MENGLILDLLRPSAHIYQLQKSRPTSGASQYSHQVVWQESHGFRDLVQQFGYPDVNDSLWG